MKVNSEGPRRGSRSRSGRQEVLDKLGFDPNDAFYVSLVSFGRGGIEFLLDKEAEGKYASADDKGVRHG